MKIKSTFSISGCNLSHDKGNVSTFILNRPSIANQPGKNNFEISAIHNICCLLDDTSSLACVQGKQSLLNAIIFPNCIFTGSGESWANYRVVFNYV